MKSPILLLLFILGMVGYVITETCPPEEDISPCSCKEKDDDIVVFCGQKTTVDQIKGVLKTIAGKQNVQLELREINFGKIPATLFKGVHIKKLDFFHCQVESFTDSADVPSFTGLENSLEDLFIIGSINEEKEPSNIRIDHLIRLRELELSYNKIKELKNECCEKVPPALEVFIFYNNGVEKLGDRVFSKLNNLRQFAMHGNRFGSILRSMLPSSPDKLVDLELDDNGIDSLPEDIFTNMPSLRTVSLTDNRITTLDKGTWGAIWDQLGAIYLQGNPLKCDSNMKWLSDLRKTAGIHGTCRSPPEKDGLDLQDFLDGK